MQVVPRVLPLLFAAALSGACGTVARRDASPQATLTSFADALERGNLKAAYALLSDETRSELTYEAFSARVKANPTETKELAKSLRARKSARSYTVVELANGESVRIDKKADQYFIAAPLADFYSQATPRRALDSFVRAVERSRWDVVLALMPNADRKNLDAATLGKNLEAQIEELTRMVALLKATQDAPIEIVGDRASMPYGESYTARFILEDGAWKIEDPE